MPKSPATLGLFILLFLLACQGPKWLPVYTLAPDDQTPTDFSIFKQLLKNKRVVMLGEFCHGAKEINQLRKEFIQYLHAELGYEVVLFESGIGEGIAIQYDRSELSAARMVTAGVTGPWHTEDYVEIMEYVKANPGLTVAGFDVQRTGRSFDTLLQLLLTDLTTEVEKYATVEKQFGDIMWQFRNRKVKADQALQTKQADLVQLYEDLHTVITDKEVELGNKWGKQKIALVRKTFSNRLAYLAYFMQFKLTNDYRARWAARDSLMANNALWLIEELYPNKKVILNAHNFHISKYNKKELTMGEVLADRLGDELYSIGVFGGKGAYANNGRKPEEMTLTKVKHDVQQIILQSPNLINIFPIPTHPEPTTSWLFEPILVNHSFISLENDKELVPAQAFDAVIGVRQVSPPTYIN